MGNSKSFTSLTDICEYLNHAVFKKIGEDVSDKQMAFVVSALRSAMYATAVADEASRKLFIAEQRIEQSKQVVNRALAKIIQDVKDQENNES